MQIIWEQISTFPTYVKYSILKWLNIYGMKQKASCLAWQAGISSFAHQNFTLSHPMAGAGILTLLFCCNQTHDLKLCGTKGLEQDISSGMPMVLDSKRQGEEDDWRMLFRLGTRHQTGMTAARTFLTLCNSNQASQLIALLETLIHGSIWNYCPKLGRLQ